MIFLSQLSFLSFLFCGGVATDLLYIVSFIIATRCSGFLYIRLMMCILASLYIMLVVKNTIRGFPVSS